MKRDDFSQNVKNLLAKRVGYLCSLCECPTAGANEDSGATNIGIAGHICAASPGGPRYAPNMTSEQRKSFENGIWMCHNCSDKIDKNFDYYTIEKLRGIKDTAEQRANKSLGMPNLNKNNSLYFTLFYESNGTCLRCGKTLVLHSEGAVASNRGEIVYLTKSAKEAEDDDNAIVLCKDCIPFVPNMTDSEKDTLQDNKRRLAADSIVLDAVTGINIAKEIEVVLREIDNVKNERELANVDIKELIEIDRKISELYLRDKINTNMVRMFKTVNEICANLEQEIGFDTERFGKEMKFALETVEYKIKGRQDIDCPQEYITTVLVETLYLRIGQRYQAACEIIVAYLIKRCDLFNENAK